MWKLYDPEAETLGASASSTTGTAPQKLRILPPLGRSRLRSGQRSSSNAPSILEGDAEEQIPATAIDPTDIDTDR